MSEHTTIEKHFGESVCRLGIKTYINEDYAKLTAPPRLNVKLYPHQETAAQALLDIEDRCKIHVAGDKSNNPAYAHTSAAVLSEPYGSGKTFIALAYVIARPVPKAFPQFCNAITISSKKKNNRNRYRNNLIEIQHEITVRFNGESAHIKPTLIVVGSPVLIQWENTIRTNTNLRVLSVGDFYGMQKFMKLFVNNDLHQFQIILLKNGTVTGSLNIGDGNSGRDYMSLIYAMAYVTRNHCWSRVIYDDFDTIKIPPGSYAINALFSLYMSATTKENTVTLKTPSAKYPDLATALETRHIPLNMVLTDTTLFSNFNIQNEPAFTERSTRLTKINKFRYVYANPDDNFIRLAGAIGDDEARETVEALNAGAYGHAAAKWGCESKSPADIFKRMLDKKYDVYMEDQYKLDAIEKTKKLLGSLGDYPEDKKFKASVLDNIRGAIARKTVPQIKYYDPRIMELLDEMTVEYTQSKERNGIAINRVIDNIKQGDCQICQLPLEDEDVFIVRCCGLIVCSVCGIKGNQIALRYNYKIKANTVCGKCANCKADVFPQTDLIYVDRKFDMASLMQAKGDEKPLVAEPEPEPEVIEEPKSKEPEIKNPKLKALLKIIRREKIPECENVPTSCKIKNLLEGSTDIPQTDKTPMKMLVFAGFDETLNTIESFLIEQKITFLRLCGSARDMGETAKKFKTYGTVLLVNSQQYCAGLDLQFSTDLVFFHKIINENIEGQVAGRIQRIGRTVNAHIHYLCFNNERNMI